MKFCYNTSLILPKQSQKSRSILQDGSRFLGLFLEGKKICFITKEIWYSFIYSRAPNDDYTTSNLQTVNDNLYLNLFDEVVVDIQQVRFIFTASEVNLLLPGNP